MRRLALLVSMFALAACDPSFQAGRTVPETPPAWTPPPMAEGEAQQGGEAHGGAPGLDKTIADLKAKIAADTTNKDLESRKELAELYVEQGNLDKAAELLAQAEVIAPKDADLKVRRANVLLSRKDQGAAKAEIEAAAKLAPDSEGVLRAWGGYYLLSEDLDKAVAARKKLLAKYPDIDDAETIELWNFYLTRIPKLKADGKVKEFFDLLALASKAQESGHDAEAVEGFKKAVAIVPDDPTLWVGIGQSERRLGKKEEAMAHFKKALAIDRSSSKAKIAMARALAEDGDTKGSLALLADWQKTDPRRAKHHEVASIIARLEKGGPFDTAPQGSHGTTTAGAAGTVSGTVTIAPELAAKIPAGAGLLIFARSGAGGGPPLAVHRDVAGNFPLSFSLSQADSMTGAPFQGNVYLTARIKVSSGGPGSGPGDMESSLTDPVPVGTGGVELRIDSVVQADGSKQRVGGGGGVAVATAPPTPPVAAAHGSTIRGRISVSPALQERLKGFSGTARLFVFARSSPAGGMPLAVSVFSPVPSFPATFELSQDNVMMPGTPFEGQLWITARVDGAGTASASPGDLEGTSKAPVAVGTD